MYLIEHFIEHEIPHVFPVHSEQKMNIYHDNAVVHTTKRDTCLYKET